MIEDQWLSTREACNELGITIRTLYRLIDEGQIVANKFGRVIRVRRDEIDQFIANSRIQPGDLKRLYPRAADRE